MTMTSKNRMPGLRLTRRQGLRNAALAGMAAAGSAQASATARPAAIVDRPVGDGLIIAGAVGGSLVMPAAQTTQALVKDDHVVVIDCGAGGYLELVRAGVSFPQIRDIFLTHSHLDHTLDLPALMVHVWTAATWQGLPCRLTVWGPAGTGAHVRSLLALYGPELDDLQAQLGGTPIVEAFTVVELDRPTLAQPRHVGSWTVQATEVPHTPGLNLAYRFDSSTTSIVFSGDTGPSAALVTLAEGADTLVHEAVFMPDLEQWREANPTLPDALFDSFPRIHTEADQVGRIAAAAGVQRLVLDHLIPFTTPAEVWTQEVRRHFRGKLVVAAQPMTIPLRDHTPSAS
ncbi:MAG: MBL fold metallo-hydrolase [Dermatophilaceae bacterium]